ncbi:MAG TPA: 3'-5' exonuclease [Anaerolineales bacterium]|nr:3'-5' exonuclease [Anaerolineales bacterium]
MHYNNHLMQTAPETIKSYISIDVETSGPNPGQYSMLSIGACTLTEPRQTFYIELKPDKAGFRQDALAISGLSMETLANDGTPPKESMQKLADWLKEVIPEEERPLFVAFNAPFDWMFINDYFMRYLGFNPFGHAALDIKSYFMGQEKVKWSQTSMRYISDHLDGNGPLSHNALQDAIDQAKLFEKMLANASNDKDLE